MKETAGIQDKHTHWFDNSSVRSGIREKSLKGGYFTILGQSSTFLINFGSTMIMARLLTPEDFGIITMVTAITGFVMMFKDMGLSSAIIQAHNLNQKKVSTLFWINLAISALLGLLLIGFSPLVAAFYQIPKLIPITSAYGAGVLLAGLSQQHSALLSRQMQFNKLAQINISAVFLSTVCGILAAINGLNEWSIVIQHISLTFFTTVGMWLVCSWKPSLEWKPLEVKQLLGFGVGISGFNLINYFSRNMDNILIGRYLGTNTLGLYSKAYQLLMLPITQLRDPLNTVCIPALSSLVSAPERFRLYYLKYLSILSFFSMPIVVFMAVFAKPLMLLFLGPGWEGAVLLFQLLTITAFIQPLTSTASLILISTGQSKRYFLFGLINSLLVVASFIIGIQFGIEFLIIGYAVLHYITLLPILWYCFWGSRILISDFFKEIALPGILSISTGAATWILLSKWSVYSQLSPLFQLLSGSLVFFLIWSLSWFVPKFSRTKALLIKDLLFDILRNKSKK